MLTLLVCGDRNWTSYGAILSKLQEYPSDSILIHGGARGADTLAGKAAESLGWEVIEVKARWDELGKAAGPLRNLEMLKLNPDVVIGFHNDIEQSKGTKHMLTIAKAKGTKVLLYKESK